MARELEKKRTTSPGMGRVIADSERVTKPEIAAVGVVARQRDRATVRGETKWFSTPPLGMPLTQNESIGVDGAEGAARLSAAALKLLLRTVPRVIRSRLELAAAPIDHREGFVLAHIDGETSIQGLIDVAGMPDDDVLSVLQRLRHLGLITLG